MLKQERFNTKQNTAMGQIPRSIERISSFNMCFYNCSVFIYSTFAGLKCEINLILIVTVNFC